MTIVQDSRDRVVVGIDASQNSRYAVLWAAEEARIRRCALVITHVDPLSPNGEARHASAELDILLAMSAAAASLREPAVPVGTLLIRGDVSDELVALSRTSALLVLGVDPERRRADYGALGPLEDRVVAHSRCPVVVVRGRPPVDDAQRRHLLVGWTNNSLGRQVLGAAATEAALRADTLTVMVLPAHEGSAPPDPESSLEHQIEALKIVHQDLVITVERPETDPLVAVLDHGRRSDLLIAPAEQAADRWSVRIGSWAADFIQLSPCPVMLLGRLSLPSVLAA